MAVKLSEISGFIEREAPVWLAEDYDNVGLMLGNRKQAVEKVLVCLDVTRAVAEEAIRQKAQLIISHHPLIFKGLKRIYEDDLKGRILYPLIQNNIAVYSAHTNLDVARDGVNSQLAAWLGLKNLQSLNEYKNEKLFKLVAYIPESHSEAVRDAITNAGAGFIGNYKDCTFSTKGTGTFFPLDGTKPFFGENGKLAKVDEIRLETVVPQNRIKEVIAAMLAVHPYEEPAYDLLPLELKGREFGLGMVGELDKPMPLKDFILAVKENLNVEYVRLIGDRKEDIERVAVFCGSFDEDYSGLKKSGADILVTGDVKYHTAMDMLGMGLCVIDAGHFNTEKVIVSALAAKLRVQFPQIEVLESRMEADPFKIT